MSRQTCRSAEAHAGESRFETGCRLVPVDDQLIRSTDPESVLTLMCFEHRNVGMVIEIQPDELNPDVMVLRTRQCFEAPLETVFAFFADAANLESITPPWLRFRIETPLPIEMRKGTLIDYRLRLYGIPIRWRTEICDWQPPVLFADRQLQGPYRQWHHTHTFEEFRGGTLMTDVVEYSVPGGRLVNRLMVEPQLRRVFGYRRQHLAELDAAAGAAAD